MKNKKLIYFLSVSIILCFSVILIYTYIKDLSTTLPSRKMHYAVTQISLNKESNLGSYEINFNPENNKIVEIKNYSIKRFEEAESIYNKKEYYYDDNNQIVSLSELEKYNGEEKYKKQITVKRSLYSKEITITIDDNLVNSIKSTTLPKSDFPVSINNSYVLISALKGEFNRKVDTWSCYDISGSIDQYQFLGNEKINSQVLGNAECIKINVLNSFDTTYWINESGIILQVEQKTNNDYTLVYKLISLN